MQDQASIISDGDAAQMPSILGGYKRWIVLGVKGCVSALLIAWLLSRADFRDILGAMGSAHIGLVVAAFALNFVGYFISGNRWRVLLRAQGIEAPLSYLILSYMTAMFFNNLLPSTVGGDALRAYDVWRVGRNKAAAVAVILVDRFLGLLALMLFASASLLIARSELSDKLPLLQLFVAIIVVAMSLVVWLIFSPPKRVTALLVKIKVPFSQRLQRILDKLIAAISAFQGRREALAKALGLSLLLQANVVVHYYLIARALDFEVPFHAFFLIIPLAIFVMMMPVSINAIGLREGAFVFLLAGFGVTEPQAMAFAWIAYGLVLVQGMLGGLVYVLRR